jgi:hypothetical protein
MMVRERWVARRIGGSVRARDQCDNAQVVLRHRHADMTGNDTDPRDPEPARPNDATPDATGRERPTPEGDGLDPTRYGDWEKNGRCIDF